MPTTRPYQLQQPIRNLQQLKAEKRRLKAHIKASDEALRQRVEGMPGIAMLRGLQHFGSKIIHSKAGSYAADFFSSNSKGKIWPALLKSVALFAGIQLAKYFLGYEADDEEPDWSSLFSTDDDDDVN